MTAPVRAADAGGATPRIVLFGFDAVARELAGGLAGTGARVATLGPDAAIPCLLDTLEEGRAALDRAVASIGGVDALVWAWVDPDSAAPAPLGATPPELWAALAEEPLHRMLLFLKLAHHALGGRGGTVVLLVPSLAMTGAGGLVPWATVSEGQRSIAKSVARKWGPLGITVNSLAVPAGLLVPAAGDRPLERPGLPPMSLPGPCLRTEVAALVASLLTPPWRAVTGVTIGADGGRWMTP